MKSRIVATLLVACTGLAQAVVIGTTRFDAPPSAASSASAASGGNVTLSEQATNVSKDGKTLGADSVGLQALDDARVLITAGHAQEAIDRHIAPLLADLEAQYRDLPGTRYCANTTPELLIYLLQSSLAKKEATAVDSNLCNAYFLRGYAEVDLGQTAAAEADFERALALSPLNPHYLSEMGDLHLHRHDNAGALAYFAQAQDGAVSYAPKGKETHELTRALRGAGYAQVELGKLADAEASYRRCLELDPGDDKAKAELGYVVDLRAKAAPAK